MLVVPNSSSSQETLRRRPRTDFRAERETRPMKSDQSMTEAQPFIEYLTARKLRMVDGCEDREKSAREAAAETWVPVGLVEAIRPAVRRPEAMRPLDSRLAWISGLASAREQRRGS